MNRLFLRIALFFIAGSGVVLSFINKAGACDLTFATPELKPHFWMENGRPTGISIDYLTHVAERAGCQFKYIEMPWRRVLQEIKHGRVDFSIGFYNKRRAEFARFSTEPFGQNRFFLFAREGSPQAESITGLLNDGRQLIYPLGWHLGELKTEINAKPEKTHAAPLHSSIRMIMLDRADALLGPYATTLYEIDRAGLSGEFSIISNQLAAFEQFIFFSRKSVDAETFQKIDQAMTQVLSDNILQSIENKYITRLQ